MFKEFGMGQSPTEIEEFQTKERAERIFTQAVAEGRNNARDIINKRFENLADPENRLDFHNWSHTETMARRTIKILGVIRQADPSLVSERDMGLGSFGAFRHDTVQEWQPDSKQDGDFTITKRARFVGPNEEKSADEAEDFMNKINAREGLVVFTEEDKKKIREGIMVTVPGFVPDKGVIQPNLNEKTGIIARAMALADLGGAGMDGYGLFFEEGDNFFREDNLDIAKALKKPELLSDPEKEFIQKRMNSWSRFQVIFATSRKNGFEEELNGLSEKAKEALRIVFNQFDKSIEKAKERADKREKMSFEELVKNFGYRLETVPVSQSA